MGEALTTPVLLEDVACYDLLLSCGCSQTQPTRNELVAHCAALVLDRCGLYSVRSAAYGVGHADVCKFTH